MSTDAGSWTLAWLSTLLPEPPMTAIAAHKPVQDAIEPHSKLMMTRWVAAHMAYLRDADSIIEQRKKAQGRRARPAGPKGGGKGDKDKKKDGE